MLTDRGTFDFLSAGGTLTAGPSTIPNLAIVTRDNSATAPGGANALINYFHVYIINPSKPGEAVNVTAAQDFVNFITSPTVQGQLKNYLANTGDPGGAPFVADASPKITATGFPTHRDGRQDGDRDRNGDERRSPGSRRRRASPSRSISSSAGCLSTSPVADRLRPAAFSIKFTPRLERRPTRSRPVRSLRSRSRR